MTNHFTEPLQLVNDAKSVNLHEFVELIDEVTETLRKESGTVGNMRITGRLIEAASEGEAIIVGDIHGDLDSLAQILSNTAFVQRARQRNKSSLIFLGDYGDRGIYSPEVYYVVLKLKQAFPENVILMRGNHEGPDDLLASPHDLPMNLHMRFGQESSNAYRKLRELFNHLYNAVIVEDRCVMLHGGVPSRAKSLDDLAYADLKHPKESCLEEILWSDPEEGISGTYPSPRGAGMVFGQDVTIRFLNMLNVKVLIRGHEPADEGFKINHSGRILTLFSRKGEPYLNSQAAYLELDLSSRTSDAYELRRFIRTL